MGNQIGTEKKDKHRKYRIDWENAERPSPPGKPYLYTDDDQQADLIIIRWDPPDTDGGAPIRGFLVEHRRTGSPHWLRASPYLTKYNELILTGLEPGWRYQFRVSAENDLGLSEPGEISEPLTVTLQRSAATAPHFNRELEDLIALENEKVEFQVQVIATPAPKICWYKDGFEVFSSRRTKIITDSESSTFIIHQAALEDEGEIKCTATNRAGHIATKAYLKLEAPPRIRLPKHYEDGLIFEKGEMIRLKVSTAGRPSPEMFWFHDGEQIDSKGRYEIVNSEGITTLRIKDATRSDRGEYLVQGENKIGVDNVFFLVTVTDRPLPPGRPEVVMTLGRSVTLTWVAPEDDGGCKVGNYIVEYFKIGWGMWLKGATSRQLTATLSELIEGSEYKFRVKAENPYGISEPGEESQKLFIPDPQRGILKPTENVKGDLMWLDRTDQKADAKRSVTPDDEIIKSRRVLDENADRLLGSHLSNLEEDRKRSTTPEDEPTKRRRLLEEKASRLLDSPYELEQQKRSLSPEDDTLKRRRLLEEKASRLLDTPLPVLLPHSIDRPTRYKNVEEESPPVAPKRRRKKTGSTSPHLSPPMSPNVLSDNEDGIIHGSSELMLLILPEATARGRKLSQEQRLEIERMLGEEPIPPPMSLSAPELGIYEPMVDIPMRDAISSTELLHERALSRLYQDATEEQFQRRKSLERKPSLREATVERRHSIHSHVEDEPPISKIPIRKSEYSRTSPPKSPKLLIKSPQRLNSVERENLEFAKIRDQLKIKNSPQQLVNTTQRVSLVNSQMSSYDEDETTEEGEFILDEEDETVDDLEEIEHDEVHAPVFDEKEVLENIEPLIVIKDVPKITLNEKEEDIIDYENDIKPLPKIEKKKPKLLSKLSNFTLKRDKKPSAVDVLIADSVTPITSVVLPKPILKKKVMRKKGKEKSLERSPVRSDGEVQKKQVRITEPNENGDANKTTMDEGLSEEDRANMVLINHYSDIVREFGTGKRPQTKLYLQYEELEEHEGTPIADENEPSTVLIEPETIQDVLVEEEFEENKPETDPDSELELTPSEIINDHKPEALDVELEDGSVAESGEADEEKVELTRTLTTTDRIRNFLDYMVDMALFVFACWLYLFKNELYCIPILIFMVYRQINDALHIRK